MTPRTPGSAGRASDTPSNPPDGGRGRPLRADARRNRAKVLDAAAAVFAAQGPSASTEEVARRAGVAIGTVFRHYPTKEALLEAVFVEQLLALTASATALADAADAGSAFFTFFRDAVEQSVTKAALTDAATGAGAGAAAAVRSAVERVGTDLRAAAGVLLGRAQRAGAVRADLGVPALVALLAGTARAVLGAGADPQARAQVFAVVVDGMRGPGRSGATSGDHDAAGNRDAGGDRVSDSARDAGAGGGASADRDAGAGGG